MKDNSHSINVKAEKALKQAVAKVIADYKSRGQMLALWKDGRVAYVPASRVKRSRPGKR